MNKVHSSDGTAIAFDRLGDGPPVILVGGASTDRMANALLAKLLAERSPSSTMTAEAEVTAKTWHRTPSSTRSKT